MQRGFSKTKQLIELKVFNHCEKIVRENKYALCQNSRDLVNIDREKKI